MRKRILERLQRSITPLLTGDLDLNPEMKSDPQVILKRREAAVLVPVIEREEPTVLFTERTHTLRYHAGQISFPGGRCDETDDSAVATALRETEEEVGLTRDRVEIAGRLDDYHTSTGFLVTPVVGFIPPDHSLILNANEVARTFEAPLSFLLDPANRIKESREWHGKRRYYYAIPYGEFYIWGATAGILVNLAHRLYMEEN